MVLKITLKVDTEKQDQLKSMSFDELKEYMEEDMDGVSTLSIEEV